jgi:predicted SAM-dependent methyltransferase
MNISNTRKLHLGCGTKLISGFFHVDSQALPHVDLQADIADLSMFNDESVELVYASHVLEHFGRNEYESVLSEWFRILEPGGELRLAVPDFEACAKYYLEFPALSIQEILGLICGGQRNIYDYHKMIFDEISLSAALFKTGFKTVSRWDWRETSHSHIDDYSQAYLPHLDKENGMLMSLNLKAIK